MNTIKLNHSEILRKNNEDQDILSISKGDEYEITIINDSIKNVNVDDAHFSYNSSFFLPARSYQEETNLSGIELIAACIQYQYQEKDTRKMIIAGNTDSSGSAEYNVDLSKIRADVVYAMIIGDRTLFQKCVDGPHLETKEKKNEVLKKDRQSFLEWASIAFGWDCSLNQNNNNYITATRKFQKQYNESIALITGDADSKKLDEDGDFGFETGGAAFDCYQYKISQILVVDLKGLVDIQTTIKSCLYKSDCPCVACGEYKPIEDIGQDNKKSQKNRRVEILFIPTSNTSVSFPCFSSSCEPNTCTILEFRREPIPDPIGGDYIAITVGWLFNSSTLTHKPYRLNLGETIFSGIIPESGVIRHPLPTGVTEGRLEIQLCEGQETWNFWDFTVDSLQAADETSGIQQRLMNLGWYTGSIDNQLNEETSLALRSFEQCFRIISDDAISEETTKKLKEIYGC